MGPLGVSVIMAAGGIAGFVTWRQLSRRRSVPCPVWMVPLLENPYVRSVAGASILLERAHVDRGMRILDVGCGPGRLAVPAAERVGPQGEVLGVDIQPGMLSELESRARACGLTNVRTLQAAVGQGRIGVGAFDRALLVTVLGGIPDRVAALRDIQAALRPNGLLSITEVFPDPHYQARSKVLALAEQAGLEFEEAFGNRVAFTLNFRSRVV